MRACRTGRRRRRSPGPDAGSTSELQCSGWCLGPGGRPRRFLLSRGVPGAVGARGALDLDRLEDNILDGSIASPGTHLADLVDDVAAADDLAENGVPAVEMRCRHNG